MVPRPSWCVVAAVSVIADFFLGVNEQLRGYVRERLAGQVRRPDDCGVAVEDDVGLACGDVCRVGRVRCRRGQELDGFVDVAADGGRADAEPGGEVGAGVAAAQMGQDQQGLVPAGSSLRHLLVQGRLPGEELEV
jgi:hypothetical protein